MRIPLDYYRILGLPIQATAEQLRQAHRDRTLQLPRREFSDAAILARRELLDQAHGILSDPAQRQHYDTSFLAKTYDFVAEGDEANDAPPANRISKAEALDIDPHAPSIEIEDDQFIGALLILQELGEYELVLKLGRPFLTGGNASLQDQRYGDPAIVFPDIVLTVALACLELGREQWQQGQYENAAEALETGQELLLREGLFATVRGEIQSDLSRLRPYRVLELVARPEVDPRDRQRGIQLLQDMLNDRGGIEGSGDDQSGLNIDDFLRFVQQLRAYLTVEEQQHLFEREALRPSAVATYLAVYAHVARGFAECQPELIYQAKQLLSRLSARQDVHLEQAVCSLLLGQTESASQSLGHSQEQISIDFIREHSQDSPDLLPGLCLYTERWLQDEVYPHFRDLAQQTVSLKDYFADGQVQTYLETLPSETELNAQVEPAATTATHRDSTKTSAVPAGTNGFSTDIVNRSSRHVARDRVTDDAIIEAARAQVASRSAMATLTNRGGDNDTMTMPPAERVSQPLGQDDAGNPLPGRDHLRRRGERPRMDDTQRRSKVGGDPATPRRSAPKPSWLPPAAFLLGVIALGLLVAWLFRSWQASTRQPPAEALQIQLDQPLVQLPEDVAPSPLAASTLDNAAANKVLDAWLTAKASAMGADHNIEALNTVLIDPRLTEWRNRAESAKREGWYIQYKHDVTVESVELDKTAPTLTEPDQAKVVAQVKETSETFSGGNSEGTPQVDNLKVQYLLVRKDGQWQIQDWTIQ